MEQEYVSHKLASIKAFRSRVNCHLLPYFGHLKAADVGTIQIKAYQAFPPETGRAEKRRERHHQPGTGDHAAGLHDGLRRRAPVGAPALQVHPTARTQRPRRHVYAAALPEIGRGLPESYRTLFILGYFLGCPEGKLLKIKCSEIDLIGKKITLLRSTTKNKKERILPLYHPDMVPRPTTRQSRPPVALRFPAQREAVHLSN